MSKKKGRRRKVATVVQGGSRFVTVFCPYCRAQPHESCCENTPEVAGAPVISAMYECERQDGLFLYVCPKCAYSETHTTSIAPPRGY